MKTFAEQTRVIVDLVEAVFETRIGMQFDETTMVKSISDMIQSIAEASQQQSWAIGDIAVTVASLGHITQQNAAMPQPQALVARSQAPEQLTSTFTPDREDRQPNAT